MKLTIKGKEILTLHFNEDDLENAVDLKFSDFFISLPKEKQIAILETHGRTIEEDIKACENPRVLKQLWGENMDTGEKSEPDKEQLIYWSEVTKIIVAVLRNDELPTEPRALVKHIKSIKFSKGN